MKIKFLHFVVTSCMLLFFTSVNFAQAPNLGTAANFVIFTSNGAVTNTGKSNLTGNVGSNIGAATGFGNVNGVMHSGNGASAQAAADLLIAYYQVDTTSPTFFHAPLLGNGDTLHKGVYAIAGNSSFNLNLTLDAQGNPNAVFIFKIAGTFSTGTASRVILINGAKACNVFWKVEGLISMATETSMKGTMIANNAAINMATGVLLEGRALSTTGAISISGLTGYTPVGCGSPILTGPAAPGLASTACYAIFSGNGSVINAGITTVKGDVGTNVGLAVGYDSLKVQGKIHPIPDGSTSGAATDLLNVYTYLHTLPNDIELLYPLQFGNSLVLTPHTYILNGAATFTDTLFLDAAGNTNGVFVIKINGALSTSTYATVVLLNGATAGNVFWKVEGAVNLNDYSNFKGTIICNNGAISLNTGVILDGRALTTDGALSTAAVTVTIPPSSCSILPLTWLYFRGKPVKSSVLLEWGTAKEINNSFFTIEKSRDGSRFTTVTTVNASGETNPAAYAFTDLQPSSLNYYRILQTDKDGKKSYSGILQVKTSATPGFKVLLSVGETNINLQTAGAVPGNASVGLYSMEGKKIASQKIILTQEQSTYTIGKPAQKGMYLVYIESFGEKRYAGKIMVL